MKTILLLRHGKSDWEAEYGEDHERPLAKRGRSAAKRAGSFLRSAGTLPDLVLTSPAVRAADTVRLAAAAGNWTCPIETRRELYQGSLEEILEVVRACPDSAQTVLLAGHEPAWSQLAGALIGGAQIRLPTAAVARIDLPADSWREAAFGAGVLNWLITPKLLKRGSSKDD